MKRAVKSILLISMFFGLLFLAVCLVPEKYLVFIIRASKDSVKKLVLGCSDYLWPMYRSLIRNRIIPNYEKVRLALFPKKLVCCSCKGKGRTTPIGLFPCFDCNGRGFFLEDKIPEDLLKYYPTQSLESCDTLETTENRE